MSTNRMDLSLVDAKSLRLSNLRIRFRRLSRGLKTSVERLEMIQGTVAMNSTIPRHFGPLSNVAT